MSNIKHRELIDKMTLEEKVCLCSGANFWETEKIEQYNIPSLMLNDGPHGLRKQDGSGDNLGLTDSLPATCFPAACSLGSSWNTELISKVSKAIGEEALEYGTDVVLGPGVNIKRNPLCGRNFEYFSEDPYLSGKLAAAWIKGIEGVGISSCLKHFACNNQETERYLSNSIVDVRALREIYLMPFEIAVKEGNPSSIMCSYNKINGVYASDNTELFRNILRNQWGYQGLAITDWGSLNDKGEAFKAGVDLEMPWSGKLFDKDVIKMVQNGELSEEYINESVDRLLTLADKQVASRKKGFKFNREDHYLLAKEAAIEGAVLLKNEDEILPLDENKSIAIIGALASRVRYQGAGSSHINPIKVTNILKGFNLKNIKYDYYPAYEINGKENDEYLNNAIKAAAQHDIALVVIGLPEEYESEGYDRKNMKMPASHLKLIEEVYQVNENIVVILLGGSPIEMPWISSCKALLNMYLAGEAIGEAVADIVFGKENPSGKLAETYPIKYEDTPSADTFGISPRQVEYRESIYVGYRYYDKAKVPVRFPFGFGLSYTRFKYSNIRLSNKRMDKNNLLNVSCKIKNIGKMAGAEVIQLYVKNRTKQRFRADKELKGFTKVFLKPREEKIVEFFLDSRAFSYYSAENEKWCALNGNYDILIGSSSQDIRLNKTIYLKSKDIELKNDIPEWYMQPAGYPAKDDFEKLLKQKIPSYQYPQMGKYNLYCTLNDMKENLVVRIVINVIKKFLLLKYNGDEKNQQFILAFESITNTPVKRVAQVTGGEIPLKVFIRAIELANQG